MPTFTGRTVKVTSQTLDTSLTLDQMRTLLGAARPGTNRTPGWGASNDTGTRLDRDGVVGTGRPAIEPLAGDIPQRLSARYFHWVYDPVDDAGQQSSRNWVLDGVDILVSASGQRSYLVLYSTADANLVSVPDGSVSHSLLALLRAQDPSASLSEPTALDFSSPDVYLWLAQKAESREVLGGQIRVWSLGRVSAEEDRRRFRSSTLSGDVDMQRITFLNAIAEGSALGPAVVTISEPNAEGKAERVAARVWTDGSFAVMMTPTIFRDIVDGDIARLEAVHRLAYRYLPLINTAYEADSAWGTKDRDWLVIAKRVELAAHYNALAESHPRWAAYEADPNT